MLFECRKNDGIAVEFGQAIFCKVFKEPFALGLMNNCFFTEPAGLEKDPDLALRTGINCLNLGRKFMKWVGSLRASSFSALVCKF